MAHWQPYTQGKTPDEHSITGDLRITRAVHSPQLDNTRDILVWLPDSYTGSDKRYPVLYMHDGQNLFDDTTSFVGEWHVDETMQALAPEGYEAIIVGIPNNANRVREYNPYPQPSKADEAAFVRRICQRAIPDPQAAEQVATGIIDRAQYPPHADSPQGADYTRFIVETLKPLIDSDFRTLPDRANTGIAGSSMGGLISLYAYLAYPEVFSFAGVFSPAFWFGEGGLYRHLASGTIPPGRVYLDVGTQEGDIFPPDQGLTPEQWSQFYLAGVDLLRDDLQADDTAVKHVIGEGHQHNESAWSERLPDALRFLLPR